MNTQKITEKPRVPGRIKMLAIAVAGLFVAKAIKKVKSRRLAPHEEAALKDHVQKLHTERRESEHGAAKHPV